MVARAGDGLIGGRRGLGGLSEDAITNVESNVRSVYLPVPRNVLPNALQLFDFADNSSVAGDRELTIVPSQALYWMNSQVVEDQCAVVAEGLLDDLASSPQPRTDALARSLNRLPPRVRNRWLNRAERFSSGYGNAERGNPLKTTLDESRIEELFHELTMKVLARPPLPAETDAAVDYVQDRQQSGKSQRSIWTSVTRSLFSSADYRFLL